MSTNMLIDDVAELGSEEEDEDFDEETGEVRPSKNGTKVLDMEDSSEEEDDDEDEEAAREIREGFIVEDEEEDEEAREERRRERKKRRREQREEEGLDEEDLDLIGEANPDFEVRKTTESKYKRLKRGHRDDREPREPRGVDQIFSDDDEGEEEAAPRRNRDPYDEFDDFIEEDDFEEDIDRQLREDQEVQQPGKKRVGPSAFRDGGLDEATAEDMRLAFGDGHEYDWALELQDEMEEEDAERPLELKDVFEPSQLIDRMLTDEDNEIRVKDVPERYQLARKTYKELELTEEEMGQRLKEEAVWISNILFPKFKSQLPRYYVEPFQQSVRKVLEFININDYEVPFIFQHRKDYLIHNGRDADQDQDDPDAPPPSANPERLLNQDDLWEIVELDLKFRAFTEKRDALRKTYDNLKSVHNVNDEIFEEMVSSAVALEELQDIQDYLHFQYSAELKDINIMEAQANKTQKRAGGQKPRFEAIRASNVYNVVRAIGITADSFAKNALGTGPRQYTEDPAQRPDDLADQNLDAPIYSTGDLVLTAAKDMFAEELVMSPRMRKAMRVQYYSNGLIDCYRTQKGLKKISEDHPYYEFKYLRRQDFGAMARKPELFLRMLKAEDEGLVNVKIRIDGYEQVKRNFRNLIESDNFSEIADAWNAVRREILDMALDRLDKIIVKTVKENLKAECENSLARRCRINYVTKLDQAPYKPKGMILGTSARVLALSNGQGVPGRDATCWAFLEEDGRVMENGKFTDLRSGNPEKFLPDGKDVRAFVELVERRKPDVIACSGWSVETKKLIKDLEQIIEKHDLRGAEYEDDDGNEVSDRLEVITPNDEVARLYHLSERSQAEYPTMPPLTKYCIALAKYVQSPLKEYAALGKDIISISFDPSQNLLPRPKLEKYLETAMVDMVNLVGVEVNEAVGDPYLANLLPYICGLGPRKASQLLKVININGGSVNSRADLVGDADRKIIGAVGPTVFNNCASFLYIEYDPSDTEADYMDNTRVHPEDYDLARKMAADALEMDEEDIKGEVDEYGPAAVVRKLVREEAQEKVNDLVLEEYAEQLETKFNQRKRATLETIRAELIAPYEELRRTFSICTTDEIFTMLTGETRETLTEGMIVPVKIRRTFPDHIEVKLDCGIEGGVSENEYPDGVGGERGLEPRQVFQINQTVRAKILYINRKQLTAQLSLREETLRRPFQKDVDRLPGEWDHQQEEEDRKAVEKEKDPGERRAQRVINHPLFFNFNAAQAEEYLVGRDPGACVIRPSSKGLDHLIVTWKVADNVYQHLDVLEMDKENELSLGKTLKIAGKWTYSDLDELIVNHVEAMAKKVKEMMKDERYQNGTKAQTDQWLVTYTEANPRRAMYAFCINPKYPGYFYLCFKQGINSPTDSVNVKVIPNAFELARNHYPDMNTLKNGFKTLVANGMKGLRR